jgi:hypothetical protein
MNVSKNMNVFSKYETLFKIQDSKYEFLEDVEYCINQDTIYVASIYQNIKFLKLCSEHKVIFPQGALYANLLANNLCLCDICLNFGCQIDSDCCKIACLMCEPELITYCLKHNGKFEENEIKHLFVRPTEYKIIGSFITNPAYMAHFLESIIDRIGYVGVNKNYYYCGGSQYGENDIYINNILTYWFRTKFPFSSKSIKLLLKEQNKCLKIIKDKTNVLPKEIFTYCKSKNIALNLQLMDNEVGKDFLEHKCTKQVSLVMDIKDLIIDLKKCYKKDLPDICFENLIKSSNSEVIQEIISKNIFLISFDIYNKILNFSYETSNILLMSILFKKKDEFNIKEKHDQNNFDKFIEKIMIENIIILRYMISGFYGDVFPFSSKNFNSILKFIRKDLIHNRELIIVLLENIKKFNFSEKYNNNNLRDILEHACFIKNIKIVSILTQQYNLSLDENCKQMMINNDLFLKYCIDNKFMTILINNN